MTLLWLAALIAHVLATASFLVLLRDDVEHDPRPLALATITVVLAGAFGVAFASPAIDFYSGGVAAAVAGACALRTRREEIDPLFAVALPAAAWGHLAATVAATLFSAATAFTTRRRKVV